MAKIELPLGEKSYAIHIEAGLLQCVAEWLGGYARGDALHIISDHIVAEIYGQALTDQLSAAGISAHFYTLPAGEDAKSWHELEKLTDWLIDKEINRQDTIIALGGGVVGDITGFASAILKRGCHFVQIPTSLLAQVDSSVGGKTAINSKAGKNLIGAFHQPQAVFIDPRVLKSLPDRHMRAGFAEVVKYGLINDAAFFDWCCKNGAAVLAGDDEALEYAIAHSVRAKANIVAQDERETENVRALLNLGHTFAHALEAQTGYSERLFHGEAVALGMVLAHNFSAYLGLCSQADAQRVASSIAAFGLPAKLADLNLTGKGETLFAHMQHDKKRVGDTLPFILSKGIGQAYFANDIAASDAISFLNAAD